MIPNVFNYHLQCIDAWSGNSDTGAPGSPKQPFRIIASNHRCNFDIWHQENIVRRNDLTDAFLVKTKRNIDQYNQFRNDFIEQLDAWLNENLIMERESPLHSETPGMMIDRLSIIALKLYHARIKAGCGKSEIRLQCRMKVALLQEQADDLGQCLEDLLRECKAGTRHFKPYQALKMYNDSPFNLKPLQNR